MKEKKFKGKTNFKKARVATLISDRAEFRAMKLSEIKKGTY